MRYASSYDEAKKSTQVPDLELPVTAVSAVASSDIIHEMLKLMRVRQAERPAPIFFSTGETRRKNLFYEVRTF